MNLMITGIVLNVISIVLCVLSLIETRELNKILIEERKDYKPYIYTEVQKEHKKNAYGEEKPFVIEDKILELWEVDDTEVAK